MQALIEISDASDLELRPSIVLSSALLGKGHPWAGKPLPHKLGNAPSIIRLLRVNGAQVQGLELYHPTGPADPDGQCLQFDDCWGELQVDDCTFYANTIEDPAVPNPRAEDLLSVFNRKRRSGRVLVNNCTFYGKGLSLAFAAKSRSRVRRKVQSHTSICLDGPWCLPTTVQHCRIFWARVGLMIAGGSRHNAKLNAFIRCKHKVWAQSCYERPIGPCELDDLDPDCPYLRKTAQSLPS